MERECKLQLEVWKKRVYFAVTSVFQDMSYQQCIEAPRAIATPDGKPIKGAKDDITKMYEKRYENATPLIITAVLPDGCSPDAVFEEGMFLINIIPWSSHKTMGDYGNFLMKQHILPYFKSQSTTEVYFLTIQTAFNIVQSTLNGFTEMSRTRFQTITAVVASL